MPAEYGVTEIEISEFRQDPGNDCAFAVYFDLRRPQKKYDQVIVYFTEAFIQRYFRISWFKEFTREEHRIVAEQRELFTRWGLVKVEQFLKGAIREDKIIVDYDADRIWARKVQDGVIQPKSEAKSETLFIYR